MTNIIKGYILTSEYVRAGEYWTPHNDYYVVCISYGEKLLTMDKTWFRDWLTRNHLMYDEMVAKEVWGSCFDPFDVGMDVE